MGLTQGALAQALHVPSQRLNALVKGRRGITPGMEIGRASCRERV